MSGSTTIKAPTLAAPDEALTARWKAEQNDLVHCFKYIFIQIFNIGNAEGSLVFEFSPSFV